jgi:hypothetical protein
MLTSLDIDEYACFRVGIELLPSSVIHLSLNYADIHETFMKSASCTRTTCVSTSTMHVFYLHCKNVVIHLFSSIDSLA